MLTAEENVVAAARDRRTRSRSVRGSSELLESVGLSRPPHAPAVRALRRHSSSAWRSHARSSHGRRSSSPTSRPATSTRPTSAEILELLRRSVDELGQTTVMVTHDASRCDDRRPRSLPRGRSDRQDARPARRRPTVIERDPEVAGSMSRRRAPEACSPASVRAVTDGARDRARRRDGERQRSSSPTRSSKAFDTIFTSSYRHTDAVVSGKKLVEYVERRQARQRLPEPARADPSGCRTSRPPRAHSIDLNGDSTHATLIGTRRQGDPVERNPTFGFGIDPATIASTPEARSRAPGRPGGTSVVDRLGAPPDAALQGRATRSGVAASGPQRGSRIVGTASYGDVQSLGGATIAIFDRSRPPSSCSTSTATTVISVAAKPVSRSGTLVSRAQARAAADRRRCETGARSRQTRTRRRRQASSPSSAASCSASAGSRSSSARS